MTTATRRYGGLDIDTYEGARDYSDELNTMRDELEARIDTLLAGGERNDPLKAAMRASALSAGKRMRPLLLMLVARDLGCNSPALVDVACAVELVHAASLILDDMPCMDNASLRRGKPAIHVQFGEDVAILASVALLSRAFGILAQAQDITPATRSRLVAALAQTVGDQGLVRGQFEDLHGGARTPAQIATTNELKTGLLLGVAVDMASIICHADERVAQQLRAFALAAGQAFQIKDDLLDGPGNDSAVTGKDTGKDVGKATLINTLGQDEAKRRLMDCLQEADRCLGAAVGAKGRTRAFVSGLFAQGAKKRAALEAKPEVPVARELRVAELRV
ncbi:polyprenyl synthetase family protein [Massilia sp. YIM B02443]|uniref:polyprenyl synthetase family protein n=1 Tax=Massilia sp. YIM B02443 TaxID=3050127 RepID=UPI0025B6C154|nr:polyprenyl synthetase family protein [Massilia sp. YIM B02443]MDN4036129.1 polyprenyl synthetase family protein [Massilia sp. YIM B02443]